MEMHERVSSKQNHNAILYSNSFFGGTNYFKIRLLNCFITSLQFISRLKYMINFVSCWLFISHIRVKIKIKQSGLACNKSPMVFFKKIANQIYPSNKLLFFLSICNISIIFILLYVSHMSQVSTNGKKAEDKYRSSGLMMRFTQAVVLQLRV